MKWYKRFNNFKDTCPEEAFDYLSDISKRSEWDEICTSAGVLEVLDCMTSIQVIISFKEKSISKQEVFGLQLQEMLW